MLGYVPERNAVRQVEVTLGGKTVLPPMDVPEGPSLAMFSDPEGNVMGIVSGMG